MTFRPQKKLAWYAPIAMIAKETINSFEEVDKYFPFKIPGIQSGSGSENCGYFYKYLVEKGKIVEILIHSIILEG